MLLGTNNLSHVWHMANTFQGASLMAALAKESAYSTGDLGLVFVLGRSPGE